jgi:hypothetical protein
MENLWSLADKQTAARLWREGWTASRIAETFPGRTRSAVIGLVHRMKLPSRPNPVNQHKERSPEQKRVIVRLKKKIHNQVLARQATKAASVVPFPAKPKPQARIAARFTGKEGCQWLNGERPTWTKCDRPRLNGASWCEEHYHRVFQTKAAAE